jgi:dienelactone hydrolase
VSIRYAFGLVGLLVTMAVACGGDDLAVIDAPDDSSGSLGEEGAYGVGWVERRFRVRVDQTVQADVYVPMTSTEEVAEGPFPLVVGIQGGGVEPKAYRWLYRHITSRGFVVLAPHHPGDLPIFATGNASEVVQALRRWSRRSSGPLEGMVDGRRSAILGHSLGGVVAAKNWLYEPESFSDLVLLASYPAESEDYRRKPSPDGDRVLSIIGGRDARSDDAVGKAHRGIERIREPSTFAVVEGMNHYQWGDLPSQSQLANDAAPTIDTNDARRRALPLIDAFLQRYADRGAELLDTPEDWPRGVVTWEEWRRAGEDDGS